MVWQVLSEVGAVLNKRHKTKLVTAYGHIGDVLVAAGVDPTADPGGAIKDAVGMSASAQNPYPADDSQLLEKQFTQPQRDALAKSGAALPTGGFPIQTKDDLKNAISAYGRAKDKPAAQKHIIKRAKALGATDLLPKDWPGSTKKESVTPPAPNLSESERSWSQLQDMVAEQIAEEYGSANDPYGPGRYTWVCDMYDGYAIYSAGGDYFSIPWAIVANEVVLGEPTEVVRSYIPDDLPIGDGDNDADDGVLAAKGVPNTSTATESGRNTFTGVTITGGGSGHGHWLGVVSDTTESSDVDLTGDTIALVEKALRSDNTATVKVIQAGWGSSAYYPEAVLREQGPKVFTRGTRMFLDHPTEAEAEARPERSVTNIAGVLESDARWLDNGLAGPGLYADVKVVGAFREVFDDLAPHIGVSIRARGKAKQGTAEGKRGPILESFEAADSVDYVTVAGAGGAILPLFESARTRRQVITKESDDMADETIVARLEEVTARNASLEASLGRLQEALAISQAERMVSERLAAVQMPDVTRTRLAAALASNPPITDGALDRTAFAAQIEETAKAELAYLAEVMPTGRIVGMGAAAPAAEFTDEQFNASLTESLGALGMTGDALTHAVNGRR